MNSSAPAADAADAAFADIPPADARAALKLACLGVGGLSLLATVVLVSAPATGAVATLVAAAAIGYGVAGSTGWPLRRALPHLLAAVLAAISVLGFCATHCGTYAFYETFLGLPTGIVATVLHGVVAMVLLLHGRSSQVDRVGDLAIGIAVGGSVFYGSVLVLAGTWCGACMAIHTLMAVQLLELVLHRTGWARTTTLLAVLAAAGGANAVYHHRPQPAVRDDATDLLTYLRGLWTADHPPQRVVPMSESVAAVTREGDAIQASLGLAHPPQSASAPAPASPASSPAVNAAPAPARAMLDVPPPPAEATPVRAAPAPSGAAVGATREVADANRWGRADAPIVLALGIDTGCPVCAQEFGQVLELKDLVDAGRLQVRLLVSYKNDAAQAMASLAYAGGLVSDTTLIETLTGFYSHQRDILVAADAVQFLPPSLPAKTAIGILRAHQADITTLMTDAAKLKETLGATGDPTLWLFTSASQRPVREFKGLTLAPILRLAVTSLIAPR